MRGEARTNRWNQATTKFTETRHSYTWYFQVHTSITSLAYHNSRFNIKRSTGISQTLTKSFLICRNILILTFFITTSNWLCNNFKKFFRFYKCLKYFKKQNSLKYIKWKFHAYISKLKVVAGPPRLVAGNSNDPRCMSGCLSACIHASTCIFTTKQDRAIFTSKRAVSKVESAIRFVTDSSLQFRHFGVSRGSGRYFALKKYSIDGRLRLQTLRS